MTRRTAFRPALCALALAAAFFSGCRKAEVYPDRPILLICPWAVGGGTDRVSRQVAAYLEHDFGVPVNVINATGGAGVTGHARGMRARPDGYTLMMMTVELNMLHWRELTDISWRDFAPVGLLNRDPAAIFVRTDDDRWTDARSLIERARSEPGTLTASGTALGGIWHLALGGLLDRAGLSPASVKWVPTGGAGPALQELASGGIDLVVCSLPEARTLLLAGKVRSLGVMADERLESYPDVPTLVEQGFNWSLAGWRGIGVPKDTPPEIVARLTDALERIAKGETDLNGQRFTDYMDSEGFNLSWDRPEGFARLLETTDEQLGALLTRPEFSSVNTGRIGPSYFPRLIISGIVLALVALFIIARRRRTVDGNAEAGTSGEAGASGESGALASAAGDGPAVMARPTWLPFIECLAAVAFFALAAETLGFLITAGVLLCYLLWRLGTRLWVSALVTIITVPAIYTFFATLMRVPLAEGLLGW